MLVPAKITTIYLPKVTASTLPGEISTRLDEDLWWVGRERKQVCTKSLIFTLSFTDHSCSLLDISFYLRIHDPDEDQCSALKLQGEWSSERSSITIDSASLAARPISGLVQRACTVYGRVRIYLPPFWLFGQRFL